jgi:pyroglutamyl-peptidase
MSITVHITGFGRFQGVEDNPSCRLANGLVSTAIESMRDPRIHLASSRVVEVSMSAADAALTQIFQSFPDNGSHIIIVHIGVAAGSTCFHLEEQAANDCSFRCPDETGAQPQGQCICDSFPLGSMSRTLLPLRKIAARMHEKWHPHVEVSCDAGRFLCNYIYYRSLQLAASRQNCYSVFIHVPLHTIADLRQQTDFICEFLRCASDFILGVTVAEPPATVAEPPAHFSGCEKDPLVASNSKSGIFPS